MKYLLDTNICVFLLRGKFNIVDKITDVGIDNCCLSEITLAELTYGAFCSQHPLEKLKQIEYLKLLFKVIPISESFDIYGKLKADLRVKGILIDDFDLLIGSSAIKSNCVLVSDNIKHFSRLGVRLKNWVER